MNIRLLGATTLAAALATAGCATSPGYGGGYSTAPSYGSSVCADCGTVTRIEAVARGQNVPNATGAVLGGIVGAVAGHEISDKTGGSKGNQNVAAAAGAVGGVPHRRIDRRWRARRRPYDLSGDAHDGQLAEAAIDGVGPVCRPAPAGRDQW